MDFGWLMNALLEPWPPSETGAASEIPAEESRPSGSATGSSVILETIQREPPKV